MKNSNPQHLKFLSEKQRDAMALRMGRDVIDALLDRQGKQPRKLSQLQDRFYDRLYRVTANKILSAQEGIAQSEADALAENLPADCLEAYTHSMEFCGNRFEALLAAVDTLNILRGKYCYGRERGRRRPFREDPRMVTLTSTAPAPAR